MKSIHSVVFGSVGLVFLLASFLVDSTKSPVFSAILLNLGLVTIAVVLIEYLWKVTGGHPMESQISALSNQVSRLSEAVDIVDAAKKVGLEHVHVSLANYGTQSDWEILVNQAEGRVDLMGRTLFGWTRSVELEELIKRKIENDSVKFRWLLMCAENKYLPLLTEEDINIGSTLESKINETIRRLLIIKENLSDEKKDHLEIRQFDHIPLYCSVTRVDENCLVAPYLFSASSDGSPLLHLKGIESPWARRYIKEFEIVWNASKPIENACSQGVIAHNNIIQPNADASAD